MDILDRLIEYDDWTNRHLLSRSLELSDEQWMQAFDIGHGNLLETWRHIVGNLQVWSDLMAERPVRPQDDSMRSIDNLVEWFEQESAAFGTIARRLAADNRLDDFYTDTLDNPPTRKTFGGTIAHVLTHNMTHRGEILHMLQRLGVQNLIEGDVLSWELMKREGKEQ